MQAIESKKAAGDTASVQQEVDGIVQQLRLHVSLLSYTNTAYLYLPSQALTSGCLPAHMLHPITTAPWHVTTAETVAVHQLDLLYLCCPFDTVSFSCCVLQQAWQQPLQQLRTVCMLMASRMIDKSWKQYGGSGVYLP